MKISILKHFFREYAQRHIFPLIGRREYRGCSPNQSTLAGVEGATEEQKKRGLLSPRIQGHVTGMIDANPTAPARPQRRASSLMLVSSWPWEGCALSKMIAFLCFQIAQAVMIAREAKPLRRQLGVAEAASDHQEKKGAVPSGGSTGRRHQESTSCQVM